MPCRQKSIPEHHNAQDRKTYEQVDKCNNNGRDRYDQSRKINLPNKVRAYNQTIRCIVQGRRYECPGQHTCQHHEGIWSSTFARQFRNSRKNYRENKHREDWTQESPNNTDDCLFVAYGNITPGKYLKEFSIAPQIAPVVLFDPTRFNYLKVSQVVL